MRRVLMAAIVGCAAAPVVSQPVGAAQAVTAANPAEAAITVADARSTALDLASKLEDSYVFPDLAKRYAAMLRANASSGAYDRMSSGRALAARLTADLRGVSPDAHLAVTLPAPEAKVQEASAAVKPRFPWPAIEEQRWLAPGVAYIRFNVFPGDDETVAAVTDFMKNHASARTIVFDLRTHHGGALPEMNAIFPYLFAKPATLLTLDTRQSVYEAEEPLVRRVAGPPGVVRRQHYVVPSKTESRLFDAKVFVLTSPVTASAAEHMALALKRTHRATLVGESTAGAGHYGWPVAVGDRFQAFIPVGRTFDPDSGKDWEGTGVQPDVAVPAKDALVEALVRSGVKRTEAERINAKVKPSGSMERRAPRRIAASN